MSAPPPASDHRSRTQGRSTGAQLVDLASRACSRLVARGRGDRQRARRCGARARPRGAGPAPRPVIGPRGDRQPPSEVVRSSQRRAAMPTRHIHPAPRGRPRFPTCSPMIRTSEPWVDMGVQTSAHPSTPTRRSCMPRSVRAQPEEPASGRCSPAVKRLGVPVRCCRACQTLESLESARGNIRPSAGEGALNPTTTRTSARFRCLDMRSTDEQRSRSTGSSS